MDLNTAVMILIMLDNLKSTYYWGEHLWFEVAELSARTGSIRTLQGFRNLVSALLD